NHYLEFQRAPQQRFPDCPGRFQQTPVPRYLWPGMTPQASPTPQCFTDVLDAGVIVRKNRTAKSHAKILYCSPVKPQLFTSQITNRFFRAALLRAVVSLSLRGC